MDLATVIGMLVGVGAIFGGFLIEGGHLSAIVQPTAALIVGGGTVGAVLLQFPGSVVKSALGGLKTMILPKHEDMAALVTQLVGFANKARREGIVSLEADADKIEDAFFKKAVSLAVDGCESGLLRDTMDVEIGRLDEEGEHVCKVFEAAGGYAPAVGIIGAVLGLIHVMGNLADPSKLGGGIAVAFVATVYGVFLSNLVFLPAASKLKLRHTHAMMRYELIVVAVTSIVNGENPRVVEQKLNGFLDEHSAAQRGGGESEKKAA